uniref:Uncharacterized protein n=1 Tax=uncultured bacterium contig00032 TaxID=1181521 RepID=A0A806KAT2_9BACT|nr:hypothetical protein [uncultured bacterium contig00032]
MIDDAAIVTTTDNITFTAPAHSHFAKVLVNGNLAEENVATYTFITDAAASGDYILTFVVIDGDKAWNKNITVTVEE